MAANARHTFAARARARAVVATPVADRPWTALSRAATFVAAAWNLALCLRTEPLLALLVARFAQLVAPTRSAVIKLMATKALVSTGGGWWFRAAGDSAQWMLHGAAAS